MTFKLYLFILIALSSFISACTVSGTSSGDRQEVVLADRESRQDGDENEIVITNDDLNRQILQNFKENKPQEQTVIADDKSKITTTFDNYGNKTETRCFVNDPRLDCVVVMTPAQGRKETLVYPVASGAKKLPGNAVEQALTATPDELANLAGVYETRADIAQKSVSPYDGKKNSDTSLRPLPSSAFPVYPGQIPQYTVEQTDKIQVEENEPELSKQVENTGSKNNLEKDDREN